MAEGVYPTSMWSQLTEYNEQGQRFILATVTDVGGSTPRKVGAQMIITTESIQGTIGGGALEFKVIMEARSILALPPKVPLIQWIETHLTHDLGMCCGGKMTIMLQDYPPRPHLWIFGAGHVGEALSQAALLADFKVSVIDERPDWADPKRFSHEVQVICEDPELYVRSTPPTEAAYVVVTTHDHSLDQKLIEQLTRAPLTYLGLIGSRGKWGRFYKRLRQRSELIELDQVKCPMGLDIGAQTPGEIAISVVAEMISTRHTVSSSMSP